MGGETGVLKTVKVTGLGPFKTKPIGFAELTPLTVIIGKNNIGKSRLAAFIRHLCGKQLTHDEWTIHCTAQLLESHLREQFQNDALSGISNAWHAVGKPLIGKEVSWTLHNTRLADNINIGRFEETTNNSLLNRVKSRLGEFLHRYQSPLHGAMFYSVNADRDIKPEERRDVIDITADGTNATNLVRKMLLSADKKFNPDLITDDLLSALNAVFTGELRFTDIRIQEHDTISPVKAEIYIREEGKPLLPLSELGSGLKTVLLVLLNMIVHSRLNTPLESRFVYVFEELENNLHPTVLRNLLCFIEQYSRRDRVNIFLTTHSSVVLDMFMNNPRARILRLQNTPDGPEAETVNTIPVAWSAVADLGAKPSDILQANGIIWVEGPSDRIYVNHWIQLLSGGELQEGRHYQCAFFAGSLLGQMRFSSTGAYADMSRLNMHSAIVADSDTQYPDDELKARVQRCCNEISALGGYSIVTCGKEIENYIPSEVLNLVFPKLKRVNAPERQERFFPGTRTLGFINTVLKRRSVDKVWLAAECVQHMTLENMRGRFAWEAKFAGLVKKIGEWNT